ncbi:MAG: flap endonuclease [Deltaproteobacteria bacterium]|nr:flap endonuclease [Deltaproteobacteria bacterium]
MQVYLVDGTYELFRHYFGAPAQQNSRGLEIGACRSLVRSLNALAARANVTHLACAFDSEIRSFRNQLFSGYKTGEGIEPELLSQFPLAERVARALGLMVWPMVEFEADDALATAASRLTQHPEVERVVICSPDKDLAQCVDSRVVLWDRHRDRWLDRAGVKDKFGVAPESIPDWLALVGDAADGVPGIPRWGAKSAAAVLDAYQFLDRIPDEATEWSVKVRGAATLAENLKAHREDALLYRELTRLRTDAPIDCEPDSLEIAPLQVDELELLAVELDDRNLVERSRGQRGSK